MVDISSKCNMENLVDLSANANDGAPRHVSTPRETNRAVRDPAKKPSPPSLYNLPKRPIATGTATVDPDPEDHCPDTAGGTSARVLSLHESSSPPNGLGETAQPGNGRFSHAGMGYLARVLAPDLMAKLEGINRHTTPPRKPLAPAERNKSEILIVTDDVSLVYALRFSIADYLYGVTWTNNFWVAMSYLHSQTFSAVVVDMRVDSVEEKYLLQFVEEYEKQSRGRKIFLTADTTSTALIRQIRNRGHVIMDKLLSISELVQALEIAP